MRRNYYLKRKVIGGHIFGNIFNLAKKAFSVGTKILSEKLPFAKQLASNAAKGVVESQAKQLGDKAIARIINKIKNSSIKNPEVSNSENKMEVPDEYSNARAVISQIISGGGFKKL